MSTRREAIGTVLGLIGAIYMGEGFNDTSTGSEGFPDAFAGNQGTMLLNALKSFNFVTGVSGWRIQRNGNVEFNNGVFRGTITDAGMFVYSGVPGLGNPPVFAVVTPGTLADPYGNNLPLVGAANPILDVGNMAGAHIGIDQSGDLVAHAANGAEIWLLPGVPAELIYDASGALVASNSPFPGTDTAGKEFVAGLAFYGVSAGTHFAITLVAPVNQAAKLSFQTAPSAAGPWTEQSNITGDSAGRININPGTSVNLGGPLGIAIKATDPANPNIAEIWHTLGSPSATGYTTNHGRYRMTPEGEVEFDIQLTANIGGGTSGSYSFANALDAAYRPAITRVYPLGYNDATSSTGGPFPRVIVATGGIVTIGVGSYGAGVHVGCHIRMPLD